MKSVTSRGRRTVAGVLALGLFSLMGTLSASASTPTQGFWYFDALNVGAAHEAGWTGEGVTIALIDSPINTEVPTLADANIEVREPSFCYAADGSGLMPAQSVGLSGQAGALHGTSVASLISGTGAGYPGQSGVKGVAPGAELLYYSIYGSSDKGGQNIECLDEDGREVTDVALADAMNEAMDAGAQIIVVSSLQTPGPELYAAQIRAVNEGVVVVGGLPNSTDVIFSAGWPGRANGAVGVQAADPSGAIQSTDGMPNTDEDTVVIAPGIGVLTQGSDTSWEDQELSNGTSYATPIVAGLVGLAAQKYPDATGNQLIQSLIHNTGVEDHPLERDPTETIGYGAASATHMLAVDPTQYPDENPLVTDGPARIPTIAEFASGYEAGSEPAPSASPSEPGEVAGDSTDSFPTALIVGVIVGAVVLIGLIVLVVLLAVRRSNAQSSQQRIE